MTESTSPAVHSGHPCASPERAVPCHPPASFVPPWLAAHGLAGNLPGCRELPSCCPVYSASIIAAPSTLHFLAFKKKYHFKNHKKNIQKRYSILSSPPGSVRLGVHQVPVLGHFPSCNGKSVHVMQSRPILTSPLLQSMCTITPGEKKKSNDKGEVRFCELLKSADPVPLMCFERAPEE